MSIVGLRGKFCLNEACPNYGKMPLVPLQNNIIKCGKTKTGKQRYKCNTCGKTFIETRGTIFYRRRKTSFLASEIFRRSAVLYEQHEKWREAAECWIESGEWRNAAACWVKAGESRRLAEVYMHISRHDLAAPLFLADDHYIEALNCYQHWLASVPVTDTVSLITAQLGVTACLRLIPQESERAEQIYREVRARLEQETGRHPFSAGRCWEALGFYGVTIDRDDLIQLGYERALTHYGNLYNDKRISAAQTYLQAVQQNQLLAEDIESRITEWRTGFKGTNLQKDGRVYIIPLEERPQPWTVRDIFETLSLRFIPDRAQGVEAHIEYTITGEDGGEWAVIIHAGKCEVRTGIDPAAKTHVIMTSKTYMKIANAQLDPRVAFMLGKIKIKGDKQAYVAARACFRLPALG